MFLVRVLIALAAGAAIFWVGVIIVRAMITPVPEPPPAGELRKVKLLYRCSICGTELRMTRANDEVPDPPRHCMEDMELVAQPDD